MKLLQTFTPPPLKLIAILAAALVAPPAMAQVDWSGISDKKGSIACPAGASENLAGIRIPDIPAPGATSIDIETERLAYAGIKAVAGIDGNPDIRMWLHVYDSGGNQVGTFWDIGTVTKGSAVLAAATREATGLKPGEKYTARLVTQVGQVSNPGRPLAQACFQMPPDLNTPFEGSGSIGGTSGCFAIGGVALGGGDAAIRACFCGARNGAGKWARTDADDGYEYMLDAAERTRRGCTTN